MADRRDDAVARAGESDLGVLLRSMRPQVVTGEFVFTSVDRPGSLPPGADPVVLVQEVEGTTLVLRREQADQLGLTYDYVAGLISLTVHSALAAVGLSAAIATALAQAGLSCNIVAGYHHDHLFVPHDRVDQALQVLRSLAEQPRGATGRRRRDGV